MNWQSVLEEMIKIAQTVSGGFRLAAGQDPRLNSLHSYASRVDASVARIEAEMAKEAEAQKAVPEQPAGEHPAG